MAYLLDTHAILYTFENDRRLSSEIRRIIEDESKPLFYSVASLWEIAIKLSIGKLKLKFDFSDLSTKLMQGNVDELGIETKHFEVVSSLPLHHRDPFDRLLVAQCLVEDLTLISNDEPLDAYGVKRMW